MQDDLELNLEESVQPTQSDSLWQSLPADIQRNIEVLFQDKDIPGLVDYLKAKDIPAFGPLHHCLEHLDTKLDEIIILQIDRFELGASERFEIAKICASKNGDSTAEYFKNFGELEASERFEIAKVCASQDGWRIAEYFKNFGELEVIQRFEIAKICASQDGGNTAEFFKNFGELGASQRFEIAKICASVAGRDTARFFDCFGKLGARERFEIAKICASESGGSTAKYFKNFGELGASQRFEIAKICASEGRGSTAEYFKNFGELDASERFEIAKICASRNGWGTAEYFKNFGELEAGERFEIAKICASQTGRGTAEYFKNFGSLEAIQRFEIAKICASEHGESTAKCLKNFGELEDIQRFEIAKNCASQNGGSTAKLFNNFGVLEASQRFEIAKICASQNAGITAQYFKNFGELEASERFEIAKICASQYVYATAEFFNRFGKLEAIQRFEIAKTCASHDGQATARFFDFRMLEASERFEVAKICASQDGYGTANYFKNFGDLEAIQRFEIAKICASQDGGSTANHFKNFGELEASERFEIAKICASQDGGVTAQCFKNFAELEASERFEIAKICAAQNGDGTAEYFKNFGELEASERFGIAKICASEDGGGTAHFFKNFGELEASERFEIAKICASEFASVLQDYDLSEHWKLEPELRTQLIELAIPASITSGHWTNTQALLKQGLNLRNQAEIKNYLVLQLNKIAELPEVKNSADSLYMVQLYEFILKPGHIPNDALRKGCHHFPEHQDFLTQLVSYYPQTTIENVLTTLTELYPEPNLLNESEQKLVFELIDSSFKGFSPEIFEIYRGALNAQERMDLIQSWTTLSQSLLCGQPIPEEYWLDPILPALIDGAYRPVGISSQDISHWLGRIDDESQHLEKWLYQKDGYQLMVDKQGEMIGTVDKNLSKRVRDTLNCLTATQHSSQEDFLKALVRVTKAGSLEPKVKETLFNYLTHCSEGGPLKETLEAINLAVKEGELLTCLPQLQEVHSIMLKDVLEAHIQRLESEGEINSWLGRMATNLSKRTKQDVSEIKQADIVSKIRDLTHKGLKTERNYFKKQHESLREEKTGNQLPLVAYMTKDKAGFFGRAGAGLCTATELWSWENSDFLQMVVVNPETQRIVGNIQLHTFERNGQPSLLARLNPTTGMMREANADSLAKNMMDAVSAFASANHLALYLPEQTGWHQLTNRDDFEKPLRAYYQGGRISHDIQITKDHHVKGIYAVGSRG